MRFRKKWMEAHRCHHKVFFFPLQCFLAKSKDRIPKKCLQKETKLLLKISPECTKSHRLFKIFRGGRGGGGGMPPDPPTMVSRLRCSHSRLRRSISAPPTKNRWLRLCHGPLLFLRNNDAY